MFATLLGWLISALSSPALGRVIDIASRNADATNSQRLAELRALSDESHDLVEFNKSKLSFPWFWALITLFIAPLGIWWTLVIADSVFYFPFDIANLPTSEMRTWAGDMIRWLFYVGSVTAALKVVSK